MKRRLFNFASAVSLLLCLATIALWIRSYFAFDRIDYPRLLSQAQKNVATCLSIWGYPGGAHFTYTRIPTPPPNMNFATPWDRVTWQSIKNRSGGTMWWFSGGYSSRTGYYQAVGGFEEDFGLYVPYWFPCLMLSLLPAWWLMWARRQRRRRKLGFCLVCGYDLRASQHRCPECGSPVASASTP